MYTTINEYRKYFNENNNIFTFDETPIDIQPEGNKYIIPTEYSDYGDLFDELTISRISDEDDDNYEYHQKQFEYAMREIFLPRYKLALAKELDMFSEYDNITMNQQEIILPETNEVTNEVVGKYIANFLDNFKKIGLSQYN